MVLLEFTCPVCQKHITWALPSATVQCPVCSRWVSGKDVVNPARMDAETDDAQLILF